MSHPAPSRIRALSLAHLSSSKPAPVWYVFLTKSTVSFWILSFSAKIKSLASVLSFAWFVIFGVVIKEKIKSSNRLYFIDNLGTILDFYKKIHPFSFANEDRYYVGGENIKIVEFNNIKFGLSICYDLRFSNLYHEYLNLKTDCIINIANWPSKRIDHWNTLLKARAIENQQFIIGVNRIGIDGNNLEYCESSNIFNSNGDHVKSLFKYNDMNIYEIDKEFTDNFKERFNTVQDRKVINVK